MTSRIPYRVGLAVLVAGLFAATAALADEPTVNKGDNAWMLTSTVLVLLMTIPGLALFYGGLVRSKNMLSVLTHVFYTVCVVVLIWVIYGYSLAFTGGSPYIGGLSKAFLMGVTPDSKAATFSVGANISELRLYLLPDDLRGDHARADRRRLRRAHEIQRGGPVHPAVGDPDLFPDRAHGLVLGRPRRHRRCRQGARCRDRRRRQEDWLRPSSTKFWPTAARSICGAPSTSPAAPSCTSMPALPGSSGRSWSASASAHGKEVMAPHSMVMTMIGASLLWVGWFGFNAGSNLEASGGAALAMINSFVATAAAAMSWMFAEWIFRGKPSLLGALSGCVAGLVAVTPASGFAGPMGAIVLGLVVGVVCLFFVSVVKNAFGYDDALDVFGVHCIGGIVGALGTGILVSPMLGGTGIMDYTTGKIADYDMWTQLISQGKAVGTTLVWSGVGSADPLQDRRRPGRIATDAGSRARRSRSHRSRRARLRSVTAARPSLREAGRPGIRRGQIPGTAPAVMGRPWCKPGPLSFATLSFVPRRLDRDG